MKIRLFSDLHTEFWKNNIKQNLNKFVTYSKFDLETVAIIPGDCVCFKYQEDCIEFFEILSQRFKLVLYVPGNHFYYNTNIFGSQINMNLPENVKILNNEFLDFEGYRFLGSTLWIELKNPLNAFNVQNNLNDFHVIKTNSNKIINVKDVQRQFVESVDFLISNIIPNSIVITHHAPSNNSIHLKYKHSKLNDGFASSLEYLILGSQPLFWFHGHIHDSVDYTLDKTRIVCNPFGYLNKEENPLYIKDLTFEI